MLKDILKPTGSNEKNDAGLTRGSIISETKDYFAI
jgi:hypothetical protein